VRKSIASVRMEPLEGEVGGWGEEVEAVVRGDGAARLERLDERSAVALAEGLVRMETAAAKARMAALDQFGAVVAVDMGRRDPMGAERSPLAVLTRMVQTGQLGGDFAVPPDCRWRVNDGHAVTLTAWAASVALACAPANRSASLLAACFEWRAERGRKKVDPLVAQAARLAAMQCAVEDDDAGLEGLLPHAAMLGMGDLRNCFCMHEVVTQAATSSSLRCLRRLAVAGADFNGCLPLRLLPAAHMAAYALRWSPPSRRAKAAAAARYIATLPARQAFAWTADNDLRIALVDQLTCDHSDDVCAAMLHRMPAAYAVVALEWRPWAWVRGPDDGDALLGDRSPSLAPPHPAESGVAADAGAGGQFGTPDRACGREGGSEVRSEVGSEVRSEVGAGTPAGDAELVGADGAGEGGVAMPRRVKVSAKQAVRRLVRAAVMAEVEEEEGTVAERLTGRKRARAGVGADDEGVGGNARRRLDPVGMASGMGMEV